MKRNKFGFTLGEILVCMMIIGVIMALSLQTIAIVKASYTSLGYFAFKNLRIAVRELYAGQTAKTTFENSSVMMCRTGNGKSIYVLKPDNDPETSGTPLCSQLPADVDGGTNTVCNNMVKQLNTTGKIRCNNLFSVSTGDITEPSISDFNVNNPTFVTTNGQRYYLTKRTYNASISTDYGFRLMAIDLNGKSKPNSIDVNTKKMPPDIITFMIMDNGEVYPIGVAADNLKISSDRTVQYINARAKGYYYSDNKNASSGSIPDDCYVKKSTGQTQVCNYRVVPIKNASGEATYSYREAFCLSRTSSQDPSYNNYCQSIQRNSLCPPSDNEQRFDICQQENIKPLFRFNLN